MRDTIQFSPMRSLTMLAVSLGILLVCLLPAVGQTVISGSPNVFSNSQATASTVVTIGVGNSNPFVIQTPIHTLNVNHGGLLATTNFSIYAQIGLVDAITSQTNWTYVAQIWQAASTNSTTEPTVTLSNYNFTAQGRLVLTTTNAMNLPSGVGAATYVTNTIIFN